MQLRPPQPATPVLVFLVLALAPIAAAPAAAAPAAGSAASDPAAEATADLLPGGFRIAVDRPGVYRVRYEDLVRAGLDAAFLRSSALVLQRAGEPVPIWVEDGGDGRLGRGDWLELVATSTPTADPLAADPSEAVYLLRLVSVRSGADNRPARMRHQTIYPLGTADGGGETAPRTAPSAASERLSGRMHLEEDQLFLRYSGESPETAEVWYWARLTPLDNGPFTVSLPLADLDRRSDRRLRLRLRFRGWSHLPRGVPGRPSPTAGLPDHRIEIRLAGRRLGVAEWSNREAGFVWESPPLPVSALNGGEAPELSLAVVERTHDDDPLVDVVMLDWVEVVYPRQATLRNGPVRLLPAPAGGGETTGTDLELTAPADGLKVYTADGRRLEGSAEPGAAPAGNGEVRYAVPGVAAADAPWTDPGVWAVPVGGLRQPRSIRPLRSAGLRRSDRQADYLMIAHPSLAGAVAPLASAHRRRGLTVDVIDVRAVYDEFGHGVAGPRAIRDFLRFTQSRWRPPAPRFVLLVGDASWDTRNRRVHPFAYADRPYLPGRGKTLGSRRAPTYEDGSRRNVRNLIPTGSTATFEGHAASDGWLARIDDDEVPDLAIGRFPAAKRSEVASMVAKTLRHLESPPVGPRRREALFISDGNRYIDDTTVRISLSLTDDGYEARRLRPEDDDPSPEARRERLLEAIDRGPLLVHFFGHGGRNIWRTGGSDRAADRDLFTLDDLDRLTPGDPLPIVLSMSCYSAPFDHPNADSIGEKFLRLADRGASAVIAASWRNTPTEQMSRVLIGELARGGTVGEALLRAKQRSHNAEFIGQYNLLGDPALPLHLPAPLTVRPALTRGERLPMVTADAGFAGRALVDWLDRHGSVMQRQELAVDGRPLTAVFPGTAGQLERLTTAQVYVWDEANGRHALGATRVAIAPAGGERPDGRLRLVAENTKTESEVRR